MYFTTIQTAFHHQSPQLDRPPPFKLPCRFHRHLGNTRHDHPPILLPHLRPILPLPLRQILHRLRSRQHRLPRRNHRHLHRCLPASLFLPQLARSVRNPSAGGRIVRSCRRFFSRFGRISGETMAGHCDFMREAVRIQG